MTEDEGGAPEGWPDRTTTTHPRFQHPALKLEDALRDLRAVRPSIDRDDPRGRDLSLAITAIEEALNRLRHGSP